MAVESIALMINGDATPELKRFVQTTLLSWGMDRLWLHENCPNVRLVSRNSGLDQCLIFETACERVEFILKYL